MDFVSELERLRVEFHERALRRFDDMEGADHPDFFIYNGEMNAWREAGDEVAKVLFEAEKVEMDLRLNHIHAVVAAVAAFLISALVLRVIMDAFAS